MEKIINFTGPSTFKRKDRHFKQNTYLSEQSENSSADEEQETSSPIYKKKSHFGKEKDFGSTIKPPPVEEKKLNMEAAFDTDESETNTPKSNFFASLKFPFLLILGFFPLKMWVEVV